MKMIDEYGISEELRSIIESTNDQLFVKNIDFVYIAASRNYALDCVRCNSVEDVIGKTDFELFADPSIAGKYRADDNALLASGKSMMEFQEKFSDKDGKTYTCYTTKYLLHDSNGKPAAIFGQSHDIRKQVEAEMSRHEDMNHKIAKAVNSVFYASYFINLEDYSFSILKGTGYARKLLQNCKTVKEACSLFIQYFVISDDQPKMREFCKLNTIAERLGKRTHIDCEYRGTFVDGWCQTSFLPVSYDKDGKVTHVLFVLSGIDQDRARNLDEGISSKKNLDVLFDVVPSGIVVYEWNGKNLTFLTTNHHYRELFDYKNLKIGDIPSYSPIHPDDIDGYLKAIEIALTKTNHLEYAFRIWNREKQCYGWIQINAVAKPQKNGTSLVYAVFTDITYQKGLEKSYEDLYQKYRFDSEHDELTGLYNRKRVFAKCRELLAAYPDERFVMVHGDVRRFHLYNTFFGEAEGNRLLCRIADLLRIIGRDYDHWAFGRIESDVFCAFFPVDQGHFEKHTSYLISELKKYRNDFPLIPAIGAYWVTDPQMSIEEMFSYATIAAKSRKTNLYGLISRFDEEMAQDLKDTQQITSEMHAAIAQEQFAVYLQPKYFLKTERMAGAEALARWNHPQRGMISPGKFIPAFEKNGFIAELDKYMWEHVCRLLRRWQDEGKPMYPVSVNVSRVSMYNHTTISFLKSLIEKYQINPKYLELELTESAYMDEPEVLKQMLKELQKYGFKILMDDFGNGYSSLNMLRDLPVDILKLDMQFLVKSQNDARGKAVLSSVVRMSKLLSLPIVAEGVETREQADYLRSIGCECAQGYLYARPMTITDYEALLLSCGNCPESSADTEAVIVHEDKDNIQKALEELFFCNFIISLSDYSFKIFKAQPYMTKLLSSCENAISAARSYIYFMVADESKDEMKAFLDMTTLQQRMKASNTIECIYHDPNIGWAKAVFSVVDRNTDNDAQTVALVVEAISNEQKMSIVDTKTKHSLEMDAGLWNSVKKMITASDIHASTNSMIWEVFDYYDADRAYIFEFDWKKNIGNNTYEVCAPDIEPMIDNLQNIPLDYMAVWLKLFREKSLIHIKDLNELIGDESRKDEYDILAPQGISSLIAVPVFTDGELAGFLGVDNPKRNLEDTTYIKSLAFFCVNVSLKEKEFAELEKKSMMDPLTAAYNRQGYNEIVKQVKKDKRPLAYAQIDIDNFKILNDTYGHGFGDEVLCLVAQQLKNTFRSADYVVRFGGDEFGIFLMNYRVEKWENISDKLRMIHMQINLILKKEIYVTLSMGISWSPLGFTDEMVSLADTALYRVKNKGRSGCCVIDGEHHVLYEWKDEIEDSTKSNILDQNNTGACRIELPDGDISKGRLICNETARFIMGFDESMTPEKCFAAWIERTDSDYRETIRKTKRMLLEKGQAECSYLYHHPTMGTIMVRSGGKCIKNKDGVVCYGYHQSLQDTRIVLREDDSQKLIQAMTNLFFASFYIDLQSDRIFVFKSTAEAKTLKMQEIPASTAMQNYVQTLIRPEYREKMTQFLELSTLPARLKDRDYVEAEYQSEIIDKDWCRTLLLAVKRDEYGAVTHVQLLFASIDREKKIN